MANPCIRTHCNILELFKDVKNTEHGFLRVSAPMVRYSKLEFRKLLRQNGVDLCFTPMIVADSFNNSQKARYNEFTTCADDQPLIAQFAAKDADEFATAAQLIYPYVDGIDLNCGCPQSWAIGKGYGVGLLRKPEIVRDIVRTINRTLPKDFSISVKIRLLSSGSIASKSTSDFIRQLEMCGITFVTIHARTMWDRTSAPLNILALEEIKQAINIPMIANGDVRSWDDAVKLYKQTKADGIMSARGLLSNPALFNNSSTSSSLRTPLRCIQQWMDIAAQADNNMHFQSLHHHLTFMCGNGLIKRKDRFTFNNLTKKEEVFKFIDNYFGIKPSIKALATAYEYSKCDYQHFVSPKIRNIIDLMKTGDWDEKSDGKFFSKFKVTLDENVVENDYNLESFFTT